MTTSSGDVEQSARRRGGRRPGENGTRDTILRAARKVFAQHGYSGATMRAIAREAQVDPALIHHFFESKAGVFSAAVEQAYQWPDFVDQVVHAGIDSLGERLVRGYLELLTSPATHDPMVAIIRSAVSHEDAAELMSRFITSNMVTPVVRAIDASEPELRATLVCTELVGVAIVRYVVRIEPVASLDIETLTQIVAPTIQHYLVGELRSGTREPQSIPRARSELSPINPNTLFQEPC